MGRVGPWNALYILGPPGHAQGASGESRAVRAATTADVSWMALAVYVQARQAEDSHDVLVRSIVFSGGCTEGGKARVGAPRNASATCPSRYPPPVSAKARTKRVLRWPVVVVPEGSVGHGGHLAALEY